MKKIITFLSFFAVLIAQHNHDHNHTEWIRCAADELEQELQITNPEFIAERDMYVEKAQRLLRENPQWRTNQASMNTIYIPVVFHVLYQVSSDNLNKQQIGYNFEQINLDFKGINPDGDEIPSSPNPSDAPNDPGIDYSFQGVRGQHQIEFVGAQGEKNGANLVEGVSILRYQINQSSVGGVSEASSLASSTTPDQSSWPGGSGGYKSGYLNIYIAPLTGGLLGQAYLGYPESVTLTESIGSVENPGTVNNYDSGRTLTHELGHNFTFNHTFNGSTCGTQYWSDIPPQTVNNRTANIYEWPTGSGNFYGRQAENSCISSSGKGDQFMNYMDYSYDDQMRMFSEEQALEGYAWANGWNWAQVVSGVNTVLTSTVSYATSSDGFTIDVTFGESVNGFTQDDIVLSNAVITSFNGGDGTTFSFDVEAIVDGEVKVSVAEGSVTGDTSGDQNFASNEIVVIVDRVSPTVGNLSIANIQDTQYITKNPSLELELSDFYDATSGMSLYFVSVGLSPGAADVLPITPYSADQGGTTQININSLGLSDYQQYYVTVYGQDLVGLNSSTVYQSFYYFGSLLGDSDGDWDVDFDDYSAFIAAWPYIDIAPITGSAPYYFPNFDGVADAQDLTMFETMWQWSLEENGLQVPNYAVSGQSPFLRVLNNQLVVKFPEGTKSGQVYFDYSPDNYNINLLTTSTTGRLILNNNESGVIHVEFGDYGDANTALPLPELHFSFQNLTDTYEFLRISYSGADGNNQSVSEGYNLMQTAPSTYRLAQSYPNPFSTSTTIEFDMPVTENIKMVILDIRGRVVRKLIDNEERFGYQAIEWDGKNDDGDDSSSGVYFYQIRSSNFNAVGKLLYLK